MNDQLAEAIHHRTEGNLEQALILFQTLHTAHPDDARVNYHFAWLYDKMGNEHAAVPYYERAIQIGLADEELVGAMLGLGSTYRCIGQYEKARQLLTEGVAKFPERGEFKVFLAMTLHNLEQFAAAMQLLLECVAHTSQDAGIQHYQRAILFYADKLDQTW
jgi:tetratricopeptide (TPR) repeat protein